MSRKVQSVKIPKPKAVANLRFADLSPDEFDGLILSQGIQVNIFTTSFCPNVKSVDGAEHQIDCSLCNGEGFLDVNPYKTVALFTSNELKKLQFQEGYIDGSEATISLLSGVELQYFYLIELLDFTNPFFQRIKRSKSKIDVLKYNAVSVNFIVDSDGKEYFEDNDFYINSNGNVRWRDDKSPAEDKIYTINYQMPIRFRTIQSMNVNRFGRHQKGLDHIKIVKLNERWIIQKEYLIDKKDHKGSMLDKNLVEGKNDTNPYKD